MHESQRLLVRDSRVFVPSGASSRKEADLLAKVAPDDFAFAAKGVVEPTEGRLASPSNAG